MKRFYLSAIERMWVYAAVLAFLAGCAVSQQVKQDPVGASLYVMKQTYEAAIRGVGTAYQRGEISREEIVAIVGVAEKFQETYDAALMAYLVGNAPEAEGKVKAATLLLIDLEAMARKYLTRDPKPKPMKGTEI